METEMERAVKSANRRTGAYFAYADKQFERSRNRERSKRRTS